MADMTKKDLKAAPDNEIIQDYVKTYARAALDQDWYGHTLKTISKHLVDLEAEMINRSLLTKEQIEKLNM